MKVAIAQINSQIGSFEKNYQKILHWINQANQLGADLIIFPELSLCGYPPIDLLDRPYFWEKNQEYIKKLEQAVPKKTGVILGALTQNRGNAAYFFYEGNTAIQSKTLLPTYDVFDESRYFKPAAHWQTIKFKGRTICLTVCEDIWDGYSFNPYNQVSGYDLLINISASPFEIGKLKKRISLMSEICQTKNCFGIYVNAIGANDELIFDGRSFAANNKGELTHISKGFEEQLICVDLAADKKADSIKMDDSHTLYQALVLGIKDYFDKTGFKKAVLGLSGGVDSALVATLAADALGKENVTGILMPGPFSTDHSVNDAVQLAENIGILYEIIPIKDAYEAMLKSLKQAFKDKSFDLTEENIQARLRGNTVMAYSNKFGALALNTGNKSELSVGYCTLYGDMIGALAVIGDVYKTQVYELCHEINKNKERIPANTIKKAPSAELRPNQTDQDSLPPYDVLDQILFAYIEEYKSADEIIQEKAYSKDLVNDVIKKVLTSEYKRRQAPIVLKVSQKAFGSGRRIPISSRFY